MYQARKKTYLPWLVIFCVLGVLFYLCYTLSSVIMPFVIGIILAYFLDPLVSKLSRKMPRVLASLLVVLGTLTLIIMFIAFLIPVLLQQLQELVDKMPIVLNWIKENSDKINLPESIQNKLDIIQARINFKEMFSLNNLDQLWKENSQTFNALIVNISNYLKQTSSGIILMIYNLFMLPIALFYFLYVWPHIIKRLKNLIPRRYYDRVIGFVLELDSALSGFIRGQFLVMLSMGLIYGVGLSLIGLNNGFAIGFMTGFLVFVPYLGFTIGAILATLAAILQYGDIWHIVGVWVVFGIGQSLESFLITPKLIGDRIGLSPVLVIVVLLAFGSLFGFVGMLIALPVSAMGVVIINAVFKKYYNSEFYLEE